MTCDLMSIINDLKVRFFFHTTLYRKRTACVKSTPRRWVDRAGHIPFQNLAVFFQTWIRYGDGRQKSFGVWMGGVAVKFVAGGRFHDFAEIHDGHTLAHEFHHA